MFKDVITMVKNSRGCYILDTVKGCSFCKNTIGGCYGDCYANNIASRYKMDFSNPVNRMFIEDKGEQIYFDDYGNNHHESSLVKAISRIEMPFVRIGEMGDPSEDWNHTVEICKSISIAKKPIVIITKHWKVLSDENLESLSKLNVIINTSISAMDSESNTIYRLEQFNRIKNYLKSILRIVSCDFNLKNETGFELSKKQDQLFSIGKGNIVDTVFRPSKNNYYVLNDIINTKKVKFLKASVLVSMHNDNCFLGFCSECPDMCGVTNR